MKVFGCEFQAKRERRYICQSEGDARVFSPIEVSIQVECDAEMARGLEHFFESVLRGPVPDVWVWGCEKGEK